MVLGFGHHSQRDASVTAESRGRDPFIATGRGGAGNVSMLPTTELVTQHSQQLLQNVVQLLRAITVDGLCPKTLPHAHPGAADGSEKPSSLCVVLSARLTQS